ncbi:DapH/DapD/GlmU-related protein [Enterococcus wangshanyuanii]|uniref:Acetyltransferase n=1 Tax=Enterococcus wangshanyuanii TaxID=2005703 RepID=A0ABQ1NLV1_9ENTE|nr:DapH/DapD/GlmU-related protein [Enterococcus wangshanyuanii]GGC80171.1 acetyltransferase [Enterococcus wangshanyuanii]
MERVGLEKRLLGKEVLPASALFKEIHKIKENNERLVMELNTQYRKNSEVLSYLEKITGRPIEASVIVSQPFYTDFGRHIIFGKDIFINKNVTFVDLGGITIEDNVLIGPDSRILTVNHLIDPKKRRGVTVAPVVIKKNAWIGANVSIMPGITIGENAIVAADSTVTKDVPKNAIVVGSPAKIARMIDENDE